MNKKIMIIASLSYSLIHFRGDFIEALVKSGFKVFGVAPEISLEVAKGLERIGGTPLEIQLDGTGLNPFKDYRTIKQLKRLIIKHEIDLVFPYTIKPVVYGSIAAAMYNIPTVSLITGLGFTFSGASTKANLLQQVTKRLYRYALRKNELVIFQNEDDLKLFHSKRILSKKQNTAIVNGSGVNLDRYPFRIQSVEGPTVKFIIVARLIMEKGIHLFLSAAKKLKKEFPKAEFHIIGAESNTPSGIKVEQLTQMHKEGTIVFHGSSDKVPEFLERMDVFVLPTYYREGVPRSILEALSIGMPIITTDTPGCKETVIMKENGFLITPKSLESLVEACRYFLENPSSVEQMGKQSRNLAEKIFDVNLINRALVTHINRTIAK
ncbi:glycosyltransferase family 4 protein [Croceitalea rosinachiae]|uniref:Glycosyltransferase family 4 protein n=1 Tax=Croceitalea rosinachiae TaxID=3075596 RepID=A0ABU3ACC7_9FLAO|nr:glycosyltransferase family 4 protein [Croceitalea sp. F388]MDT0607838.1 glycosyltransferase family 4 protein [Croceitalea sp. F388]